MWYLLYCKSEHMHVQSHSVPTCTPLARGLCSPTAWTIAVTALDVCGSYCVN